MRKSPRRGLQRVLCFRKLPMMHRADWAAGPAAAWSSPGSTGTATIAGRSLSISEAASLATTTAVSEAVTTASASAIELLKGHRERAPGSGCQRIASAIPELLCRVPPTAGCPSLTPATWSPEKEESHVHVGRCEEARSQNY